MKKAILVLGIAFISYFLFWPTGIAPKAWNAPVNKGYDGDFATNNKLETFQTLSLNGLHGPEAVIANAVGDLYVSTHEGWIIRWLEGQDTFQKWVKVPGRPLGIAFDAQNNLWVADAYKGLVKITPEGQLSIELERVADVPIRYADDVAVAPNGKIYFSDASTQYSAQEVGGTLEASLLDLMEHGKYGRIIEYDPLTKQGREVMMGLSFANGVSVDEAGRFLMIVETGEYRVIKHWLQGEKAGRNDVVIDNLPGFPDNIHRGKNGRYWVGLTAPRSKILDKLSQKPWLRNVLQRMPAFFRPKVVHYGMVIAIDENGQVLQNLQDPQGRVYATTGAFETDDYFYVASLTAPFLARYKIDQFSF